MFLRLICTYTQKLTDADKEKRVTMCKWFCNVLENDENFLENVWFSDEAHFLLSGHVNSKNNVFGGSEVPDEVLQRPLFALFGSCMGIGACAQAFTKRQKRE